MKTLEGARRENRRRQIDFWEAIYQAYLVGFGTLALMALGSSLLPSEQVSEVAASWIVDRGGPLAGLLIAAAVTTGLRSGARGGPLAFDAPTVHFILQSPVDRGFVTRRAAIVQLRTAVVLGAFVGAVTGLTVAPALPASTTGLTFGFAGFGVVTAVSLIGCALLAGGRRWQLLPVTLIGLALVGWTSVDLALATRTAPSSMLGSIAFWALDRSAHVLVVVAAVVVLVVAVLGVAGSGGISLEASRRRASLVSQIRFALTTQDLRTVVLLRRRMNGSGFRRDPWVPIGRSTGHRFPFWRRSLQSHLRMPIGSLVLLVIIAAAAGIAFAAASHGPAVLALLPGLILFIGAYTVLEPLAQEIDHSFRWATHPAPRGHVVKSLTASGFVFMGGIGGLAAAIAAPLWSSNTSMAALVALPVGAVGAAAGAAVGTMMSDPGSMSINPLQSEVFGLYVVMRLGLPLLPALLPFVPVTVALAGQSVAATLPSSILMYTLLPVGVAWLWLGTRAPERP